MAIRAWHSRLGLQVIQQTADSLNPTKQISYVLDLTKQYHNLVQMNDGAKTQSYTWDDNVAFADGNAYLQDELGSPLRYVDSSGNTIDSYGYDVFGDDLYGNQGMAQPFGFTGYTADSIAGTYFAQAREYMPQNGRFAGEDAAKYGDNWYAYCSSNPLSFVDPLGLCEVETMSLEHWNAHRRMAAESWSSYSLDKDLRRRFSEVNMFTNRQIRDIMSQADARNHIRATITDLYTGLSFNIIMSRPGEGSHSDWSPLTQYDTNTIKEIVNPERDVNCYDWNCMSSWPNFAHRAGVLTIEGQHTAMAFHLTPHSSVMPGANPGSLSYAGRGDDDRWLVGGHMCMYFIDSGANYHFTERSRVYTKDAFTFFNR